MLHYLPLISLLLFIGFFSYDRRHLLNPILLIASLGLRYLSLGSLFYDKSYGNLYQFFLVSIALIPIFFFLSAFFFIGNGIILLKKEGKSKANFLSLAAGLTILLIFALPFFQQIFVDLPFLESLVKIITLPSFFSLVFLGGLFAGFLIYSVL